MLETWVNTEGCLFDNFGGIDPYQSSVPGTGCLISLPVPAIIPT